MAVGRPGRRLNRDVPFAAVNGLNMYYEVHGEGPPLLLLHGGSGSIPEKWIPFFSSRFEVIAMEQMGHGRTADVMDRSFRYHDMAEDTVELMRQFEVQSAVVVGYSDGGIIGLHMAIHHPDRLTKACSHRRAIPRRRLHRGEPGVGAHVRSCGRARLRDVWPPVTRRRRPLADRPRSPEADVDCGTQLHS
jgi:pimeloyl-ACP methyl ester carboxylesterase